MIKKIVKRIIKTFFLIMGVAIGMFFLLAIVVHEIIYPAYGEDYTELTTDRAQIVKEMPDILISDEDRNLIYQIQQREEYQDFVENLGKEGYEDYVFPEHIAEMLCEQNGYGERYEKCEISLSQWTTSRGIWIRFFEQKEDLRPTVHISYMIAHGYTEEEAKKSGYPLDRYKEGFFWAKYIYVYKKIWDPSTRTAVFEYTYPLADYIQYVNSFEGREFAKKQSKVKHRFLPWMISH